MKNSLPFFALILFFQSAFAQTSIPDSSMISGTWTAANSPYIIEGRAIVPNGQTLTIEPGVEVRLRSSASPTASWFDYSAGNVGVIRVEGQIIANGTDTNKIVFTRNNAGYWGTILIDENASANTSFTHCIIEYSKESRNVTGISFPVTFNAGLSIYKSTITFENNLLRENRQAGLFVREVDSILILNDNDFYNNGTNGLVISESTVHSINNVFYDNSRAASGFVSAIRCSGADAFLVGNLIYNNDDFGIFTNNNGNVHIVNNTIFGNAQGIRVENGANTFITNSIVQGNNTNFATSGTIGGATIEMEYSLTDDASFPNNVTDLGGNILNSDALFMNPAASNFTLQSASPAIDAGKPSTTGLNLPSEDLARNPRISNATIDLGAFEKPQGLGSAQPAELLTTQVYPNPVKDILRVATQGATTVSILALDGTRLGTYFTKTIDLSHLKNGVYLIKIRNAFGEVTYQKVVKH